MENDETMKEIVENNEVKMNNVMGSKQLSKLGLGAAVLIALVIIGIVISSIASCASSARKISMTPEKYKENLVAIGMGTGSGVTELEPFDGEEIGAKWVFTHKYSSEGSLFVYLDSKYNVVAMVVSGNYEYGVGQISTIQLRSTSKVLSAALGYSEDQDYASTLYDLVGYVGYYVELEDGVKAYYDRSVSSYGASVESFTILFE